MSTHSLKNFLIPEKSPSVEASVFIAHGAVVVGDVTLADQASIWYGAVLRGDINRISVGARSNVQDGAVVHVSDDHAAVIGEDVTVGHRAIIHACQVENEVLVGMAVISAPAASSPQARSCPKASSFQKARSSSAHPAASCARSPQKSARLTSCSPPNTLKCHAASATQAIIPAPSHPHRFPDKSCGGQLPSFSGRFNSSHEQSSHRSPVARGPPS
jgi:hypothetical protein